MYRDFNVYFIFGIFVMILALNFPFSYENNEYLYSLFSKSNAYVTQIDNFTLQDFEVINNYNNAKNAIKKEKYDNALNYLNKISEKGFIQIKVEQLKARVFFLVALKESGNNSNKLISNKNYLKSIDILKDSIQRFQGNFSSYKILSESFYIAKDYSKLKGIANKACLNPAVDYTNCKFVSKILLKSGMTNEAVVICKSIKNESRKNSYCSWVYKSLGNIYLSEGNENKANNYFQDAYKMNSSSENLKNVIKSRINRNI